MSPNTKTINQKNGATKSRYAAIYAETNAKLIRLMEEPSEIQVERYTDETDGWISPRTTFLADLPRTPLAGGEAILANARYFPSLRTSCPSAYYHRVEDQISLPAYSQFYSAEDFYAALFHELIHSTGHEHRLYRRTLYHFGPTDPARYGREEVYAELGAAYLCGIAGIDHKVLVFSAQYIHFWLQVWNGLRRTGGSVNPGFIQNAFRPAQEAVEYLLSSPLS